MHRNPLKAELVIAGPDLVDLLPTASALVSTSMLPFRSTEDPPHSGR